MLRKIIRMNVTVHPVTAGSHPPFPRNGTENGPDIPQQAIQWNQNKWEDRYKLFGKHICR